MINTSAITREQGEKMEQKRLHALLAELDQELKSASALDAKSQELVAQVLTDIRRLDAPADPSGNRSAETRLRELVVRFETDHPRLSGAVGQVADALGKLGI
jgi:ADP-dependent phosphofructokinase/glucokinase